MLGLGHRPAADEPRLGVLDEGTHELIDELGIPGAGRDGERKGRDRDADREIGASPPELLEEDVLREAVEAEAADAGGIELEPVSAALDAVRRVAADPHAELLIAGRTSAATLAWLERSTAARNRAIVEERGLRTSAAGQRPPASVLGAVLERDGAESLGAHLARLCEAAIIDTRVLLAHRLGAEESAWPTPEDRYASDLLLAERIADPWLAALTASAAAAPIPILLGGHTLVGPGVRLLIGRRPHGARWT
jgi:hypothetical protein